MLELRAVTKIYNHPEGAVRALDAVDLRVGRGELVVVCGPSGSGKSTLLLTIGGMIRPTSGQVLLEGQDLYALPSAARARVRAQRIGFVFQLFHLVPYLSATENVLVPALAGVGAAVPSARSRGPADTAHPAPAAGRGVGRAEAVALLERLGLGERLGHLPSELSAGERQRVALARALIKQPDLILADEPTGNLDPDSAAQVLAALREFHAGGGTVIVVTHDPALACAAQRSLRLEQGRLSAR